MKVYIVVYSLGIGDFSIRGAFATEELAQEYIDFQTRLSKRPEDEYSIEDYFVQGVDEWHEPGDPEDTQCHCKKCSDKAMGITDG